MKRIVESIIIYSLRIILRPLYAFPVKKNKILLVSYEGKGYSCNPKYIYEYLYSELQNYCDFVWCINDSGQIPSGYKNKSVRYLSVQYIYHLLTSKIIISNTGVEPFFPKRKSQVYINTWHGGGAYKRSVSSAAYKRDLRAGMTDYVLSSCRRFSEIASSEEFLNMDPSKIIPVGMPRNDIIFRHGVHKAIRDKICDMYKLDREAVIVLYAPTFRGNFRNPQQSDFCSDIRPIRDAVRMRFQKEAIMLYRCHIGVIFNIDNTINVTEYPDMQELLVASDVLITDYSSSIWDYSLTRKPGFLYTPDLYDYAKRVGFHTPIEDWPYPFALTIDDLCSMILKYDERMSIEKIERHHKLLGSYETGHATARVCELIKSIIIVNSGSVDSNPMHYKE